MKYHFDNPFIGFFLLWISFVLLYVPNYQTIVLCLLAWPKIFLHILLLYQGAFCKYRILHINILLQMVKTITIAFNLYAHLGFFKDFNCFHVKHSNIYSSSCRREVTNLEILGVQKHSDYHILSSQTILNFPVIHEIHRIVN